MKTVLLAGAGHAHMQVLQAFAREPLASAAVVLVSPHAQQVYSGMVPGVLAGHYQAHECRIPVAPLAAAARVQWLQDRVQGLDAAARRVTLASGRQLSYDLLSLDTGAVAPRDAIPGARTHALFVRPMEHFLPLGQDLLAMADGRTLRIAVLGAGAAGVELALALQHRLAGRACVSLVAGDTPLLPGHPEAARRRVAQALRRHRIAVLPERCVEVTATHVVLAGGARLACDAPIASLGPAAPSWLADSGLALDAQGFVQTGPTLQSLSHAEVFAAGDVASRSDAPHPKNGVHAVRAGVPLAFNLRRWVGGGPLQPHGPPARTLNLLACGDRRAVAAWGGWAWEGAWVWWWKDRIDRAYVRRCRRLSRADGS